MPIKDNDIYNPRLKTKQPHPYFNNDANFFHDNDENASSLVCLIPLLFKRPWKYCESHSGPQIYNLEQDIVQWNNRKLPVYERFFWFLNEQQIKAIYRIYSSIQKYSI